MELTINSLKSQIIIGLTIVLGIALLMGMVVKVNEINATRELNLAKAGYEQRTLPGVPGVYWVKTDKGEGTVKE